MNLRHLAFIAATVGISTTLPAEDWPKWRGPQGDAIVRETGLLEKWPAQLPELWRAEVGPGFSTPVAKDGRIYLFTSIDKKETLICYDAATGQEHWRQMAGDIWTRQHVGTRASPTIDGDRIYTYGAMGDLIARDLKTGKLLWQVNTLQSVGARNVQWGSASAPLALEDSIVVQGGVGGGPVAVCVKKSDGQVKWTSEQPGPGTYTAPVLYDVQGTEQLIVLAGKMVVAMNPQNGKTIWTYPYSTRHDIHAAVPIYHDGHLFVTAGYGHGSVMLKVSPGGAPERLWESRLIMGRFVTPILDNGFLYGTDESGTLRCLAWPGGEMKWETDRDLRLGLGGAFIRTGDRLIALSETGTLYHIKATPEGYEKLSQMPIFQGEKAVWASPLVYNGKLYLKGGNQFVCYDISAR